MKQKFGLRVENFDKFFALQAASFTPAQRSLLPPEVSAKLYRKDGRVTTKVLNFFEQLYMLYAATGREAYIVVGDSENGLSVADFEKYKQQRKQRVFDEEQSEAYLSKGVTVLGTKDVMEYLSHLNTLGTSPIYNYCLKIKNAKTAKFPTLRKEFKYIVSFLSCYESNKRKMFKMGIEMPDFLALLYLYDGTERSSTDCYSTVFRDTPLATRGMIIKAFRKLSISGHVITIGSPNKPKYRISPLGTSTMNDIIKKFVLP